MTRLLLALVLACLATGCGKWTADGPTKLKLSSRLSDEQIEMIADVVADVNERVGGELLTYVVTSDVGGIQRGELLVTPEDPPGDNIGNYHSNPWHGEIQLGSRADPTSFLHELLHAFGVEHSTDPTDVMYPNAGPNQSLRLVTVWYLHEML